MPSFKPFATAANTLRARLSPSLRTRGGGGGGPSRWTSPGHEERPKGFAFNRTPPPPGESRKWEDWELPCYLTSFLTIVASPPPFPNPSAPPPLSVQAHSLSLPPLSPPFRFLPATLPENATQRLVFFFLVYRLLVTEGADSQALRRPLAAEARGGAWGGRRRWGSSEEKR